MVYRQIKNYEKKGNEKRLGTTDISHIWHRHRYSLIGIAIAIAYSSGIRRIMTHSRIGPLSGYTRQ